MQRFIENAKSRLATEPIMLIAELIDWQSVESIMQTEYWREFFRKGGRAPYDHRAMFRALLLSGWHRLSYPKLERALRVRLDFFLFCGFDAGGKLPDACTLNRFQARLSADGTFNAMVAEVERQLHDNGLELRATLGALSDLKLVKMHSRSRAAKMARVLAGSDPLAG